MKTRISWAACSVALVAGVVFVFSSIIIFSKGGGISVAFAIAKLTSEVHKDQHVYGFLNPVFPAMIIQLICSCLDNLGSRRSSRSPMKSIMAKIG